MKLPTQVPAPTTVPEASDSAPQGIVPPFRTTLVADPETKPTYTASQETDARTALTRGLAEYLGQNLTFTLLPSGRHVFLEKTFAEYADPEDDAVYPSACVWSDGEQVYDPSGFTPRVLGDARLPAPDGRWLVHVSNVVVPVRVDIYCSDKEERMALMAAAERILFPLDDHNGFILQLPHYFGLRGSYTLTRASYIDDEEASLRRFRRATISLDARVAVVRLGNVPIARPKFQAAVRESCWAPDDDE